MLIPSINQGKDEFTIMTFSYYPGCTLKTKAKLLDFYGRKSAEILGVELKEIPDWQCCGGVYPMAADEIATRLSSVRTLAYANSVHQPLLTLCSACHNVLKQVNHDMRCNPQIAETANRYMQLTQPYLGETNVVHYLEMLRDYVGFDKIASLVKHPLTGKKIGAYYGCLLLRPGNVMQMDHPENPTIMEDFIRALGATPVVYAMRNECCGGYTILEEKSLAEQRSKAVLENAQEMGAEMLITACPLCLYNLNRAGQASLPVFYFTELLAQALGVDMQGGEF